MKKLYLLTLLIISSMILFSCSAAMDAYEPANVDSNLIYSWYTLTYTDVDNFDIFYQAGDPIKDFVILHQRAFNERLDESELNAYIELFNILDDIADAQSIYIGQTLNYSSTELNTYAKNIDLSLSINDIVTFNTFKDIKDSLETASIVIPKIDYYELRTNQSLTNEQYNNLELLQELFIELHQQLLLTDISRYSFEYIEEQSMLLYVPPTDEELMDIEEGYILIQLLLNPETE
ncbi:hypothetical protein KHQ89_00335 [Mycoplasmatota bacterium]|nr:hypothetical protein KHQ89_00335 [Mycoplasmatota bacterium]